MQSQRDRTASVCVCAPIHDAKGAEEEVQWWPDIPTKDGPSSLHMTLFTLLTDNLAAGKEI